MYSALGTTKIVLNHESQNLRIRRRDDWSVHITCTIVFEIFHSYTSSQLQFNITKVFLLVAV